MRRLLLAAALAGSLAGCANLNPDIASPNQAVIAINAFNAAVATGTAYLKLPVCGAPPCRTLELSQSVYSSLKAGRVARKQLLTALSNNQSAPITAIQALQAAYSVVRQIPLQ